MPFIPGTDIEGITVEELSGTAIVSRSHVLWAMNGGLSYKLTIAQMLGRLLLEDLPNGILAADSEGRAKMGGGFVVTDKIGDYQVTSIKQSGEHFRGLLNGLMLSPNAGNPTTRIDVSSGSAGSDGAVPVLMTLESAITKRLDAAWVVGNNNGGLDTGSVAPNTWYYRYLIQRSDTLVTDVLLSASATAPTMPAAYDRKRRLPGAIRTDGSSNIISLKQYPGRRFIYATPSSDINTNIGTSASLHNLLVPPIQVVAIANVRVGIASAFAVVYISGPDQSDQVPASSTMESLRTDNISGGSSSVGRFEIDTNNATMRARSTVASTQFSVQTIGFIDHAA